MSTKNAPGCLEKMNEWPLTTLDQIFFPHFSSRFGSVSMFDVFLKFEKKKKKKKIFLKMKVYEQKD